MGKSSLVSQIHKPVTQRRGEFIRGKSDQFKKDVPYHGFKYVLQALVEHLLASDEETLHKSTEDIKQAVGSNGSLLIDLVPDFKLLLGEQKAVQELVGDEAKNRFNTLFKKLFEAYATPERPLVVFIDDIQWADAASLELLKTLLTDAENSPLLFVGAYRKEEASALAPFFNVLEKVRNEGGQVTEIDLKPLKENVIGLMLGDTLNLPEAETASLASLLYEKTLGNPFFIKQFFDELIEKKLITFNRGQRRWDWDTNAIREKNFTNNVLELMAKRIKRLAQSSLRALKVSSCIGYTFDFATLNAVLEEADRESVEGALVDALSEGYIVFSGRPSFSANHLSEEGTHGIVAKTKFQFAHDRIREAVYGLMEAEEARKMHLRIGRRMAKEMDAEADDNIFRIVTQFNNALDGLEEEEKTRVATFNKIAGVRATAAIAYEQANDYLAKARLLLPLPSAWETHYALTFELTLAYAQTLAILGNTEESQRHFSETISHAQSEQEKSICYEKLSIVLQNAGLATDALIAARQGLEVAGVQFPQDDTKVSAETERLFGLLTQEGVIENIRKLKKASHEASVMNSLFDRCIISTYFAAPQHLVFYVGKSISHILKAGISAGGGVSMGWFAMILGIMGQHKMKRLLYWH